jgi:hypothetical protein
VSDDADDPDVTVETDPEPRRPEGSTDGDLLDEYPFDETPPEEDPFAEMDVDTEAVDDDVFAALDGDAEAATDSPTDAPDVEPADEGVVVPKRSYCEGCPHFAAPPEVACTNPGTTIHELVDAEHFRVSGCPVVAERGAVGSVGEE